MIDEARQTGRGRAMELIPVVVRKPDGAQCTIAPRFNDPCNDCEHFSQRSSGKNHSQNVQHRLGGKESRLVLCLLFAQYEMCRGMNCRLHQLSFLSAARKKERLLRTRSTDRSVKLDQTACQCATNRAEWQIFVSRVFRNCSSRTISIDAAAVPSSWALVSRNALYRFSAFLAKQNCVRNNQLSIAARTCFLAIFVA